MFFICIYERKHMSSPRSAPPPNTVPVLQPKHPHHVQPPCNPTPSSSSHPSFGLSTITGPTACAHPSQSRLEGGWHRSSSGWTAQRNAFQHLQKSLPMIFWPKLLLEVNISFMQPQSFWKLHLVRCQNHLPALVLPNFHNSFSKTSFLLIESSLCFACQSPLWLSVGSLLRYTI